MAARGRLVVGVEAAYEVDGAPRQNGAVVEPGIGMRLVAPFGVGCSEQAVEGERASRSRDKHPPWASSGQSSPPSLRPMSILEHLSQDRLKHHYTSRRRSPDELTIHTPILMSNNITHSNNSMNVRNLVNRLWIRFPHPIQRLTEDLDLPFDSGTQHQV